MSEREEWGPWIEVGIGRNPHPGDFVQVQFRGENPRPRASPQGAFACEWWWGSMSHPCDIIRYRIRKPRGLTILQELLENLPEVVKEGERV